MPVHCLDCAAERGVSIPAHCPHFQPDLKFGENAAALSAAIHTDNRYAKLYEDFGPQLGGFPGIWREVAFVAHAITEYERAHPDLYDQIDWVDLIDAVAEDFFFDPDRTASSWRDTIDEDVRRISGSS